MDDRSTAAVPLHVGIEDVTRAFLAPQRTLHLGLVANEGQIVEGIAHRRRFVRVTNFGAAGFAVEGGCRDCGDIPIGSLIALRPDHRKPTELGVVIRLMPAISAGRTWIGVKRLSARARPIEVLSRHVDPRHPAMLFVPGTDPSGRDDACLVDEATFERQAPIEAYVGEWVYAFELGRVRDRGLGWVLARFEMAAAPVSGIYARASRESP